MKIGAQTYNLWRTPLNVTEKLKVISVLGYEAAELAGFDGNSYDGIAAEELKCAAEEWKLDLCGAHVRYELFEEKMPELISYHKKAGIQWIAIPRPVIETKKDMDTLIQNMNKYAAQLRAEGMDLYYHCHDFEFREIEGVRPIEEILEKTDVMLEIDVYWARKGGLNVIEFLERHSDRVLYLHLKDEDEDGSCAVGKGTLPCKMYYDCAQKLGLDYVVVEDDRQEPDGITSICNSIQELRTFA